MRHGKPKKKPPPRYAPVGGGAPGPMRAAVKVAEETARRTRSRYRVVRDTNGSYHVILHSIPLHPSDTVVAIVG